MLHSDQSFPGIPEQIGSTGGTGPGNKDKDKQTQRAQLFTPPAAAPTSVCTMAGLWVRSVLTVWKRSTTPSNLILSKAMLRAMKTPVRPTPALAKRTVNEMLKAGTGGGCWEHLHGTWMVTHFSTSAYILDTPDQDRWTRGTCNAQRSVHLVQTAPLFCGLVQWSQWNPPQFLALLALANRWTGTGGWFSTDHPGKHRHRCLLLRFSLMGQTEPASLLWFHILQIQQIEVWFIQSPSKHPWTPAKEDIPWHPWP